MISELLKMGYYSAEFFDLETDGKFTYQIELSHRDLKEIPDFRSSIGPILKLHGIEIDEFRFSSDGAGDENYPYYSITLTPSMSSTLSEIIQVHSILAMLIRYPTLSPRPLHGAHSLARAGFTQALIG